VKRGVSAQERRSPNVLLHPTTPLHLSTRLTSALHKPVKRSNSCPLQLSLSLSNERLFQVVITYPRPACMKMIAINSAVLPAAVDNRGNLALTFRFPLTAPRDPRAHPTKSRTMLSGETYPGVMALVWSNALHSADMS
jgi:hypothetical protein